MEHRSSRVGVHPIWWTAALFAAVIALVVVCSAIFAGTFRRYVPVTLTSDRSGLVMESGAKVKMNGVEVGRVAGIAGGRHPVALKLEIDPDQVSYIPANVEAEIAATTAFGTKYVDLIYPNEPTTERITAGAVLRSRNVTTEVNTVFDNLVGLLNQIDVAKLSAVLTAVADGVRGQGERIGQATTDANEVLLAINPKMDQVGANWVSLKNVSDAYSTAARDILNTLDAASGTSETIAGHAQDLDALLLSSIGFSNSGIDLIGPNRDNIIKGINVLEPTTSLLLKYDPIYTCLLQGAKYALDHGAYENIGGNGYSVVQDVGLLLGDDPYRFPENLPKVGAKGGPGGQPGCGSLPDVSKNFPVRYLVTDTGFGTGMDVRPNPGIGFPGWVNYFPVTKGVPEPPKLRHPGGPAPGPAPAVPGGAPYGAPLYGPDGTPLWPGVPELPAPAPEAPLPAEAAAPSP
ncbi:MCE family protein [Mycolicibacterium confluentis]|uniref:Virulence factor n=1 Tax=Mycolicibacterium confluentis TaxID=28047 RepID=A0A7I7XZM9_9MYCO|nr:MCE family protein [Mycolicibacterium confluentis]MCV7319543.1 MCE family protein [Mycolicibacterium confluentis]ORV34167.1 MCE-family protein MCE3A [Mycolicibacterium confluentis]BBZ34564.1 virulence factor [Mycolicibacterium confluentis]